MFLCLGLSFLPFSSSLSKVKYKLGMIFPYLSFEEATLKCHIGEIVVSAP